jgi:hypothetical protein
MKRHSVELWIEDSFLEGVWNGSCSKSIYAGRVTCSYRDHWNFGWIVIAGGSSGSRGCEANELQQQYATDFAWFVELRERI